ncbi:MULTISPECIES: protein translocase subunit SecF [Thermodesulfovibrio]|uniref:Protein translocase subunit SecF n=1 Tax=Thermodesulfovibrio yellowstonii (strain ATCC 51303 / DSM 11347 / YP87) TaxID=289376 RepID=SECF_THEYD|nr:MULTISPECIES: protein translocase subunit SecF [Thermodesulfovibrio]B5YIG8.1 RecName: Full=Protein translocase subunit SecF [Thermodesulfovibrio yellowstonii DSM 11347]ACI20263.1 protein-export membrane protein SecF [Thermodesulfovibrio yellowstonii DSM 11347]
MIQILGKTNIDFLGKKYIALALSCIMIILGIFAIFQIHAGKANLGVDFAGGLSLQIRFSQPVTLAEVRTVLDKAGIKDADIQELPTEKKILIKLKKQQEGIQDTIEKALKENLTAKEPIIESVTEIGPKIGERTKRDALFAILAATAGILIYIAIRFKFHFSIGATVATFHDVMAVLGIFYILDKEINLIFISALLTIAGYSLTDTVVVFDRIRENLGKVAKGTMTLEALMNKSINEVLSRTIVTSLTTLMAAVALFFFGGEVLHDFALAMILGILVGTYSSIFVASPVVLLLGKNSLIKR